VPIRKERLPQGRVIDGRCNLTCDDRLFPVFGARPEGPEKKIYPVPGGTKRYQPVRSGTTCLLAPCSTAPSGALPVWKHRPGLRVTFGTSRARFPSPDAGNQRLATNDPGNGSPLTAYGSQSDRLSKIALLRQSTQKSQIDWVFPPLRTAPKPRRRRAIPQLTRTQLSTVGNDRITNSCSVKFSTIFSAEKQLSERRKGDKGKAKYLSRTGVTH
jgi:hypothetical protein